MKGKQVTCSDCVSTAGIFLGATMSLIHRSYPPATAAEVSWCTPYPHHCVLLTHVEVSIQNKVMVLTVFCRFHVWNFVIERAFCLLLYMKYLSLSVCIYIYIYIYIYIHTYICVWVLGSWRSYAAIFLIIWCNNKT